MTIKNDKIIYISFIDKYDKRKHKLWLQTKQNETRNYLLEEMKYNELMNKKHNKVCRALNDLEHFLIAISAVSGCVSTFAVASLVGVPLGIITNPVNHGDKKKKA